MNNYLILSKGKHYKTRIPKPPRALCYNPFLCDLIIAGSDGEIYRISLDEGKFLNTLNSDSNDLRTLWFNKELNVVMSGGGDGVVEVWDYREKNKIGMKIFFSPPNFYFLSQNEWKWG